MNGKTNSTQIEILPLKYLEKIYIKLPGTRLALSSLEQLGGMQIDLNGITIVFPKRFSNEELKYRHPQSHKDYETVIHVENIYNVLASLFNIDKYYHSDVYDGEKLFIEYDITGLPSVTFQWGKAYCLYTLPDVFKCSILGKPYSLNACQLDEVRYLWHKFMKYLLFCREDLLIKFFNTNDSPITLLPVKYDSQYCYLVCVLDPYDKYKRTYISLNKLIHISSKDLS